MGYFQVWGLCSCLKNIYAVIENYYKKKEKKYSKKSFKMVLSCLVLLLKIKKIKYN